MIQPLSDESTERSHHLIYDRRLGWEMRVTIEIGKKVVGKRFKMRLKTRDIEDAIKRRDIVISTLQKLGLTVCDRRQKRRNPHGPLVRIDQASRARKITANNDQ